MKSWHCIPDVLEFINRLGRQTKGRIMWRNEIIKVNRFNSDIIYVLNYLRSPKTQILSTRHPTIMMKSMIVSNALT